MKTKSHSNTGANHKSGSQRAAKVDISNLRPEQTCFVICPIGSEESDTRKNSDQVLHHIIEPAALENGLTAVRSDQLPVPGVITRSGFKTHFYNALI